jgi:hypothetical protein
VPRYFFHLVGAPDYLDDPEGQEFASLDAAEDCARESAQEVVGEKIRFGEDRATCAFDIKDSGSRTLSTISFSASSDSH